MIIILTGPSGSGKTTIQNRLVSENPGWYKPYNYTTREKRSESELDDYIFLNDVTFLEMLKNGHFIENTKYNGNYYALSHYNTGGHPITHSNTVIIMEPNSRDVFTKELKKRGVEWIEVFLQIDEETLINRLNERGDKKEDIEKRINDVNTFFPTQKSLIVKASREKDVVYDNIIFLINKHCG